jgi:hypothetical protein
MPAVVRAATGTTLPIGGGLVVATLTFSGAVAVVALRKLVSEKMFILGIVTLAFGVLITLAGVQYQNVGVMLFGTVVGGTGFGTVFSGTLRSVLPYAQPGERAGLLLFRRGLSFLQHSRACGRLPRTHRWSDADRRLLRHRRHPAGNHFARHHALRGRRA